MDLRVLNLAASLALAVGWTTTVSSSAAPEDAMPSATASAVGRWLYDAQGNVIGSVRGLADGGRTVIIMVGSYFRPGSHVARLPACTLSVIDGKVTVRTGTAELLRAHPRSQG